MESSQTGEPVAEIVETAAGPVGLRRAGSGPPVLFVHGSPGGSDSSIAMGRFLVEAGFEVLAPARPGYPGTALAGGEQIDQQADLHAALLDALAIADAGVVTWSGGGPSGYRLAVRHPERVNALVAFAAVSQRWEPPKAGVDERLMENTSAGNWMLRFMADHLPKSTISATLAAEGDISKEELKALTEAAMEDDRQSEVVLTMARVVGDHKDRKDGLDNDVARFGEIENLELERIVAPTLVIHGSADTDVSPAHGDHAAATIPGAEFLSLEHGTHLALFVHPDHEEAQARAVVTLKR